VHRFHAPRAGGPLLVYVRDTLELSRALVSQGCLPALENRGDVTALGERGPLAFDADGNIVLLFA